MPKRAAIKKELIELYNEGVKLVKALDGSKKIDFSFKYQGWYTPSLKAVATFAPDRYSEFRGYYEIDPKRKTLSYATFVIQDYLKNVVPSLHTYPDFDSKDSAARCFSNQLSILHAIIKRFDSLIGNIEGELYASIQDGEIAVAKQLAKISLRAAGALLGVVIEGHLQTVAAKRGVEVKKKHPAIGDLNDLLKNADVIDTPAWRKISYLADIRNTCSHKKDIEPTKEQIQELIQGAEWLTKNIF